MGMPDIASKIFMKNPKVFADLFNFVIHDGKQEITEKMLHDKDSTALLILPNKEEPVADNEGSEKVKSKQKDKGVQKYRDVFKELIIKKDSSAEYILCLPVLVVHCLSAVCSYEPVCLIAKL